MGQVNLTELEAEYRVKVDISWRILLPVLLVPLIVFGLLTPHIVDWLNPPTGDEPFYLTTAISLIQDHDLDETNQYDNHVYWDFYPSCQTALYTPGWGLSSYKDHATDNTPGVLAPGIPCKSFGSGQYLAPHASKGVIRPGLYTKHGVGLSFLIAPAYALAGRIGVVFFLNFLMALVGLNLFLLAYETTRNRTVALMVWATMLFTVPFISYAFLIFPAAPAALCVIYAFRRLRLAAQARIWAREHNLLVPLVNTPLHLAIISICIGFLPWLHSVYLSLALPLVLYLWLGGRDTFQNLRRWQKKHFSFSIIAEDISLTGFALALIILVIFGALFAFYYLYYYGTPLPNTQDHAGFAPIWFMWNGILGLFFDQKYGLLVYAPYYLIALAGIALLGLKRTNTSYLKSRRSDLFWLVLVAGPNFLIMSDYNQWWGEWCPPARYLVPFLPLLAMPFALALAEMRNWLMRSFYIVSTVWSFMLAVLLVYNPHLEYHWQDTNSAKFLQFFQYNLPFLKNQNLGAWFPSYVTILQPDSGIGVWLAPLLWFVVAVALGCGMVWFTLHQKDNFRNSQERSFHDLSHQHTLSP